RRSATRLRCRARPMPSRRQRGTRPRHGEPASRLGFRSGAKALIPIIVLHRPDSTVRLLFGSLLAFIVAAVIGLGATWLTLSRGTAFGSVAIGAWTAWPKSGT